MVRSHGRVASGRPGVSSTELAGRRPPHDLPERVVVGANGAYWRDYGTHYSMPPVSDDNDPVEVVAIYVRQGRALQ